jgi:hypothetical protein
VVRRAQRWSVVAEEFPWRDDAGSDQFIDIIATSGRVALVIECKKTTKETLTFLQPSSTAGEVRDARCLYLTQINDSTHRMELACSNWCLEPPSADAAFCVVNTSASAKDQRLLERDGQRLVRGVDAYGRHAKISSTPATTGEPDQLYVPVIATNAKMFLAYYSEDNVDLSSGQLVPTGAKIEATTCVRFSKPFTSSGGRDVGSRTIMVVSASTLGTFLGAVRGAPGGPALDGRVIVP